MDASARPFESQGEWRVRSLMTDARRAASHVIKKARKLRQNIPDPHAKYREGATRRLQSRGPLLRVSQVVLELRDLRKITSVRKHTCAQKKLTTLVPPRQITLHHTAPHHTSCHKLTYRITSRRITTQDSTEQLNIKQHNATEQSST